MNIINPITNEKIEQGGKSRDKNRRTSLFSLFDKEISLQSDKKVSEEENVENLKEEIDKIGAKLEKEPTLGNFREYREALSKLAKKMTSEAYRLEKFGGTPQNPRYYEIITVINHEADKLYEMIIRKNQNRLAITATVINIKGLVVDLIG